MWRNVALALVLVGATLGTFVPGVARADDANPEAVRRAKTEFEDGSQAYRAERWELAASHFEAADEAVPDDRALRMALRSRHKAGHKARAATLAAAALRRYPNDDSTVDLANELLGELRGELHEIEITCTRPCVLTVGTRVVPGRRAESWTVFLDPGPARVSAAFETGGPASHQLDAVAGGSGTITLEPTDATVAPPAAPTPTPATTPHPSEGMAVEAPPDDGPSFIEHPGVFVAALVATAGLGGVTIWSGIDTLQDPGEETVREACRGEGTSCREYQLGLEKQLRTNILIGATAGMAVLTGIIGLAVTDWGGDEVEAASLEAVSIDYGATAGPDGGLFTLRGRF